MLLQRTLLGAINNNWRQGKDISPYTCEKIVSITDNSVSVSEIQA
jgi:hypothetical protein